MIKPSALLGIGLLFAVAACTAPPAVVGPSGQGDAAADLEIQQTPWNRYYPGPYYGRDRDRMTRRANAVCGDSYRACITRDQQAHPGAPGALFGGSPEGQAACQRAMTLCYRRYGVTPSEPRVN